jgi:ketosteroid isomerase-like protein
MIVPLVLLLTSPAQPGSAAHAGGTAARTAVRRADTERCAAMAARDLDRFLTLLADDVAVFPDQQRPVQGKAAVRELWAPFFDGKGPSLRCEPSTAEVARSGELAYTTGTYLTTGTEAERSPTRGHGKYVTIWRKRGGWKVILDIGNASPPVERDFGPPPPP